MITASLYMIRKKSKEFWPSTQDPEARYDKRGPATNTDKLDLASRQDGWTYSYGPITFLILWHSARRAERGVTLPGRGTWFKITTMKVSCRVC